MFILFLSALFGLIVGSFLGCCVYRIPRDIPIWNPSRSFCPHCHSAIRWFDNVPVVGWIRLGGRCSFCKKPISWRYPLIELLTAGLFIAGTYRFGFPVALSIWLFYAALVAATFIDLELLLIPDVISFGCLVLGLLFSTIFPELHSTRSPWIGIGDSAIGALSGAAILFVIGELGKLAFGRYKLALNHPVAFRFENQVEQDRCLFIDGERFGWDEHFFRGSDRIRLRASNIELNGEPLGDCEISFLGDHLQCGSQTVPLSEIKQLMGTTSDAEFPREAMGRGDVKLLAGIGSFVGWKGIMFCVPIAALVGSVFGVAVIMLGRRGLSARVPFGPFLSLAAILWTQTGPQILALYWRWIMS